MPTGCGFFHDVRERERAHAKIVAVCKSQAPPKSVRKVVCVGDDRGALGRVLREADYEDVISIDPHPRKKSVRKRRLWESDLGGALIVSVAPCEATFLLATMAPLSAATVMMPCRCPNPWPLGWEGSVLDSIQRVWTGYQIACGICPGIVARRGRAAFPIVWARNMPQPRKKRCARRSSR